MRKLEENEKEFEKQKEKEYAIKETIEKLTSNILVSKQEIIEDIESLRNYV